MLAVSEDNDADHAANRNVSSGSAHALSGAMREQFDDPQTYQIIGAAMAVHRELGCGFLEAVSREALTIELKERGIPFSREVRLPVRYRNRVLPVFYTVDFICHGDILVELKSVKAIGGVEMAQLINYLRVANRSRGLLLNFGAPRLEHKRLVLGLSDDPVHRSRDHRPSGGAA